MSPHITQLPISRRALDLARPALTALTLLSATMFASAAAVPAYHAWAATPPMGWNSWDAFGTTLNETKAKAQADVLADKLLPHGWNIFTVDIQWYEPASRGFEYRKDAKLTMDAYGRLLPAVEKFPSAANGAGFKPLADYVHAKGLKFGIHVMEFGEVPESAISSFCLSP